MTIFRERDRRAEDRKRRSRGGGRGETKVEIRPPSVGRGVVVSMMVRGGAKMKGTGEWEFRRGGGSKWQNQIGFRSE